jgi:hypothetical protein
MDRKLEVKLTKQQAQEYWASYSFKHTSFEAAKRFKEKLIRELLEEGPDQGFTEDETYGYIWQVVFGYVVGLHKYYNGKTPGGCEEISAWVNWDDNGHVTLREDPIYSEKDEDKAAISKKRTAEVETTEASSTDLKGKMKFKSPRKRPRDEERKLVSTV